jgi:beta-phosphoglucomutase-like phosphatase (HAD superfamily)
MSEKALTIDALLWDLEGIFTDTEELHYQAWKWMVETYGHTTLSREEYAPCVGRPGTTNMDFLANLKNISGNTEEIRLLRRKKFEELLKNGIPLIAENIALAKEFKVQYPKLRHALVSSASTTDIQQGLLAADMADFFEVRVSYEDTPSMRRKPAPDQYLHALSRLALTADRCISFEDTESGVVAATEAGIRTVALPNALTIGHNFASALLILKPGQPKKASQIIETIFP